MSAILHSKCFRVLSYCSERSEIRIRIWKLDEQAGLMRILETPNLILISKTEPFLQWAKLVNIFNL